MCEYKNVNEIKISVPSYFSSLSTVRSMIRAYLRAHKINETDEVQLIYVVDELATNAIEHGYKKEKGEIKIVLNFYEQTFFLVVEDYGIGFTDKKSNKKDGGIGLVIAKKLVDVFEIKRKAKGTIFRVKKRIKEAI